MCNKQRDNHNRRQITGKKPRIYAVFKTFCIVVSQANDKQMTSKHQSTMHFLFLKSKKLRFYAVFSTMQKVFEICD
nr:MAG TPA: hypothetical protein [Caudoviricetes sp.]